MPSPVDRTQQDIRRTFQAIVSAAQRATSSTSYRDQTAPAAPASNDTTRGVKNRYARNVFFKHTNILQIAAQKMVGRSERRVEEYADTLYDTYLKEPAKRIRHPFHRLKFSSREAEGLFWMAVNVPLESEAQLQAYERKLALYGIRSRCFVDMTRDNCLLEDQAVVVAKLQKRFHNWSGKLDKLTHYLEPLIEKRTAARRSVLLEQLQFHSSFSDIWECIKQHEKQILDEVGRKSEERELQIWHNFRFNDDTLNRKYKFGSYCPTRASPVSRSRIEVSEPTRTYEVENATVHHDPMHSEAVLATPTTHRNSKVTSRKAIRPQLSVTSSPPAPEILPRTESEDSLRVPQQDHDASVKTVVAEPAAPAETVPAVPHSAPYTLEDIKRKTNVRELLASVYSSTFNIDRTWTHSEMERVIRRYYRHHRERFLAGILPESLRLLTREEQDALQKLPKSQSPPQQQVANPGIRTLETSELPVVQSATPVANSPAPATPETIHSSVELITKSPASTATQKTIPEKRTKTNVVPTRKRPIIYDSVSDGESAMSNDSSILQHPPKRAALYLEDSITGLSEHMDLGSPAPRLRSQSVDIPSSFRFEPPICSTQKVAEELAPTTPEMVAQNETEMEERIPSPSEADTSLSVTVVRIDNLLPSETSQVNLVSPEMPILVRHEEQTQSSVHCVDIEGLVVVPIEPPELIDRPPETPDVTLVSPETPTLVKRERQTQSPANCSDYEGFVEEVPLETSAVIVIDDSIVLMDDEEITYEPAETVSQQRPITKSPTMSRLNEELRSAEQNAAGAGEPTSDIGTPGMVGRPHQRRRRSTLKSSPSFRLATTICERSEARFEFLTRKVLLSFRYTHYPVQWPQCNELQENRLSAQLRLSSTDNLIVTLQDRDVVQLLGLPPGGHGSRALVAALRHVGRFRYGLNEPQRNYDQLSVVEKVLQLYLGSVPGGPLEGGAVVTPIGSNPNPGNGTPSGSWKLTPFNYQLHSSRALVSSNRDQSEDDDRSLAAYLAPSVEQQMKNWKAMSRNQPNSTDQVL